MGELDLKKESFNLLKLFFLNRFTHNVDINHNNQIFQILF